MKPYFLSNLNRFVKCVDKIWAWHVRYLCTLYDRQNWYWLDVLTSQVVKSRTTQDKTELIFNRYLSK